MPLVAIFAIFMFCPSFYADASIDSRESLALRRIEQLKQTNENSLLQSEILRFIKEFPQHECCDTMRALLFSCYLQEKNFGSALIVYSSIKDTNLIEELQTMKWEALYQTMQYDTLYEELRLLVPHVKEAHRAHASFYFAEAALREAITLLHYSEGEEKARRLCNEALSCYENVKEHPSFEKYALLGMAEIYRILQCHQKAAELYLKLANTENSNEDLLFHAAIVCVQFDHEKALELFECITKMQGKHKREAAYQWMQLLAHMENWEKLLSNKKLFLDSLQTERHCVFHFYCGMYHAANKEYGKGLEELKIALNDGLVVPHDLEALNQYAKCAYHLKSITDLSQALDLLYERYPLDSGQVAIACALLHKECGMVNEALSILHQLIMRPYAKDVLQIAHHTLFNLLIELERWDDAFVQAERYYPIANDPISIAKEQLQIGLKLAQSSQNHSHLIKFLEEGLEEKKFGEDSLQPYVCLLARCYLKESQEKEALKLLSKYEEDIGEHQEFLTLYTYTLVLNRSSEEKIIAIGEKALNFPEIDPIAKRIHLYLFNAYLGSAKKQEHDESVVNHLTELAQNHLYQASLVIPISLQNRIWLANRFYKQDNKDREILDLLAPLFQQPHQALAYPHEALLLINCYFKQGAFSSATDLLQILMQQRESLEDSLRAEIQLLYAIFLQNQGKINESRAIFENVAEEYRGEVSQKAKFGACRLDLLHGSDDEKALALKKLKEIWMRKCIDTEPLHLEAATEYTRFLCLSQEDPLKRKSLWEEMIGHFSNQNDIWSKDYQEGLKSSPNKQKIHRAFLCYMRAQALKEKSLSLKESALSLSARQCALEIFKSIQSESSSLYLKERVAFEVMESQCR